MSTNLLVFTQSHYRDCFDVVLAICPSCATRYEIPRIQEADKVTCVRCRTGLTYYAQWLATQQVSQLTEIESSVKQLFARLLNLLHKYPVKTHPKINTFLTWKISILYLIHGVDIEQVREIAKDYFNESKINQQ